MGTVKKVAGQGHGDNEIIISGSLLLSMPADMPGFWNQESVVADYVCSGFGGCADGPHREF